MKRSAYFTAWVPALIVYGGTVWFFAFWIAHLLQQIERAAR